MLLREVSNKSETYIHTDGFLLKYLFFPRLVGEEWANAIRPIQFASSTSPVKDDELQTKQINNSNKSTQKKASITASLFAIIFSCPLKST